MLALMQAERSEVSGLKGQVEAAKEALQREQELVEKIKKEAAAATANAQRQVSLGAILLSVSKSWARLRDLVSCETVPGSCQGW